MAVDYKASGWLLIDEASGWPLFIRPVAGC